MSDLITEEGIVPLDDARDGFCIGVDQQLRRIEPVSLTRVVRPVHPVAVQLTRFNVGKIDMVLVVGLLRHGNSVGLGSPLLLVEQAQFDASRVFCKQRKVDAFTIPGGAEGIRNPRIFPDTQGFWLLPMDTGKKCTRSLYMATSPN